nr:acyloxyacyl hydrolase [Parabacteroides sp.]
MKNWKVLITICVLGCTRICAQETGANDTVSRHPLTHGVGIDFRPVYLIPTNEFFAGENAAWQPLRKSVSAHLKYSFRFHPDSRYGKLYPHTYQGIGVSYHSFFDKAEIGTPVAVYAFQGARI